MPSPRAAVGVDLGSKKTGLAVALEGVPLPRSIVPTSGALEAAAGLAAEVGAATVVVGMPDACYPARRKATDAFVRALRAKLPASVALETVDEGCTTFEADAGATEDPSYGGAKPARDDAAAAAILGRWLAGR